MSIIQDIIKKITGGKKKMKTLIEVPATNFLESNLVLNANDELKLTGKDGNNVSYDQTIPGQSNAIIFFDNETRNFVTMNIDGQVSANMLVYKVVRVIA